MKYQHTIGGLLSAAALVLCLSAPASADYADLSESHWAFSQMDRARALGVANGVGNNLMDPQGELTWGQFLAMAGRAFAPERYRSASQSLPWDLAGYRTAREAGLLSRNDALPVSEKTLDSPISRQDTAVLLSRAAPERANSAHRMAREALSDYSDMDSDHQRAVDRLYAQGIIKGKSDGSFGPDDTLQRADGAVLLMRTLECVDRERYGEKVTLTLRFTDRNGAEINVAQGVAGYVGASLSWLVGDYMPQDYTLYNYDGSSTVSSACSEYNIIVQPLSQLEIERRDASDRYYSGEISLEEYTMQDFWLRVSGENYRKHVLLFGNADQRRFDSRAEAEQHMAVVTVPVWHIRQNAKVAATASVQVHAALAEEVTAIFTDIFNDPEQFPIENLDGYSWRGDIAAGEHNCGTAIDINPEQNYQIRYGEVLAGSLWVPGENPYSIPPDGSVVRIFAEHGWSWGGNAWASSTDPSTGNHDYMHFSYMGA